MNHSVESGDGEPWLNARGISAIAGRREESRCGTLKRVHFQSGSETSLFVSAAGAAERSIEDVRRFFVSEVPAALEFRACFLPPA